jgi:hypothetical protein
VSGRIEDSGRWLISGFTAPSFFPFLIALTGAFAMIVSSPFFLNLPYTAMVAIHWPKLAARRALLISCRSKDSALCKDRLLPNGAIERVEICSEALKFSTTPKKGEDKQKRGRCPIGRGPFFVRRNLTD